jgi:hypothetical protein
MYISVHVVRDEKCKKNFGREPQGNRPFCGKIMLLKKYGVIM